jgi:glycerol-3-phosphate dehydrogenase (NAD(P)+)
MPFSGNKNNNKKKPQNNMQKFVPQHISVLGAGSWGTAVALALAYQGHHVLLWARNKEHVEDMQQYRINRRYLPLSPFPDNLKVTNDLPLALNTPNLLIGVPSHAFADLLPQIKTLPASGIAWLTKGVEPKSERFFSDILAEQFGNNIPMAIISGPSFAKEVAQKKPTALVVAGNQNSICLHWQHLLHSKNNRVYISSDLIGVQLCGAVKNVLAIACGMSDGLEYGANSRAALITRGIHEMTQLGLKLGANVKTFTGLAGLGDLVLTCTDNQSRNRRFGLCIGQGMSIDDAAEHVQQVVEGLYNAEQVFALSKTHQIDMPICDAVHRVLKGEFNAQEAARKLLERPMPDAI